MNALYPQAYPVLPRFHVRQHKLMRQLFQTGYLSGYKFLDYVNGSALSGLQWYFDGSAVAVLSAQDEQNYRKAVRKLSRSSLRLVPHDVVILNTGVCTEACAHFSQYLVQNNLALAAGFGTLEEGSFGVASGASLTSDSAAYQNAVRAQKRAGYLGLMDDEIKSLEENWMPTDGAFRFALGSEMDTRSEAQAPLAPLAAANTLNSLVFTNHFVLNHSTNTNLQRLA